MPPHAATFDRRTECPMCGATETRRSRWLAELVRRCTRCHLSYRIEPIHPLSTPERVLPQLEAIDASRAKLFERVIAQLGDPSGGAVLVDLGASSGYFVEFAAAVGWRAIGIELGQSLAAAARDLDRCVIVGNAEFVPIRTDSAAAVTLWDVLDQFDRPAAAIGEAARVLRPGGILWLRVRNGPVHEFLRSRRWLPAKLSVLQNNLYSPRCLRNVLSGAGFEKVRVIVSPTSSGDPYGSMRGIGKLGFRLAKTGWDVIARSLSAASGGRLLVSPSVAVIATRARP